MKLQILKKQACLLVVVFSILAGNRLLAHDPGDHPHPPEELSFIENKNQWAAPVRYKVELAGGLLYLEKGRFTFDLWNKKFVNSIKHPDEHDETLQSFEGKNVFYRHVYRMQFLDASPDVELEGRDAKKEYSNYYLGNDRSRWASRVPHYEKVVYRGLYEGVDMHVYSNERALKYDFIVQPQSDPDRIRLAYEGADDLVLNNGNLVIQTKVNEVTELEPYAYQEINGRTREVKCAYVLKGNKVSFALPNGYDPNYPLVIDPTLVFSTYSGAGSDNWGFTATYDEAGNGYAGGIVFGGATGFASYPTTAGAFQENYQGGTVSFSGLGGLDVAITKYNATATARLYSTYLGGSGNEMPHSMVVNNKDELVVMGVTSSTDFPVSNNAHDQLYGGGPSTNVLIGILFATGTDIFISKFSADGTALPSSTYMGGSANDGLNSLGEMAGPLYYFYGDQSRGEVIVDDADNVYVASVTNSADFFVPALGSFGPAYNGGDFDAVVFKMDEDLSTLEWGGYLGGAASDAAYSLHLDANDNVYVTGGTVSANFPTTGGVINQLSPGGIDGFLTHIANDGSVILNSTFIGTLQYDQSYFVQVDNDGDVYVVGQTEGPYPVSTGVYSNPNSGQFIHKLSPDLGTTHFSTVYGSGIGEPNIGLTAFLVDNCKRIYAAGWGGLTVLVNNNNTTYGTTTGMPVIPGAEKDFTDGRDFHLLVLEEDANSLVYGTFFGGNNASGEHVDGGSSRFDKRGVVYQSVCACHGGFPTTPGVVGPNLGSFNCNNALFKFAFEMSGVEAIAAVSDTLAEGCAPHTVTFENNSFGAVSYRWYFDDGDSLYTSNANPVTHTYQDGGTYTAMLVAIDQSKCLPLDTTYITVNVLQPPDLTTDAIDAACGSNNGMAWVTVNSTGGPYDYNWSTTPPQTTDTASNLAAGIYTVTVTDQNNGCEEVDTVTISNPGTTTVTVDSVIHVAGCYGDSTGEVHVSVTGGSTPYTYNWSNNAGTPNLIGVTAGTYTLTVTDATGCAANASATINEPAPVQVSTDSVAHIRCNGTSNGGIYTSASGGTSPYTYSWSNTDNTQDLTNVSGGTYSLTVTDDNGCTTTLTESIDEPPALVIAIDSVLDAGCSDEDEGAAYVTVTGGASSWRNYQWSNDSITEDLINVPAGTYTLVVTDVNNCQDSVTITVPENSGFSGNVTTQDISCNGRNDGIAHAEGSGGTEPYSYTWEPGGEEFPILNDLAPGTYIVHVTDDEGCTHSDTVTINEPSSLTAEAGPDIQLKPKQTDASLQVDVSGGTPGYAYSWEPGENLDNPSNPDPVATQSVTTTYGVSVTDANGCTATDSVTVIPVVCEFDGIYFSNAFTPNEDDLNETFAPVGVFDCIETYEMHIWNRWGEMVFRTNDPNKGWNGRRQNRGQLVPQGTYVYLVSYTDFDEETHSQQGYVYLIR